ncbi:MAG: cytochrome ubiquinol oxidase subunit I [Actinomycetota bacterium]|nr:cytochrome ubiquinol oxidase subunit I [Actinomycetota bacterium]
MTILWGAAGQPDLWAARQQMALSLGWHIIVACFGVGFPALVVAAEAIGIRRKDADAIRLARRWSKVMAVLFAVGAVSGTILSFELGILWPGLMGTFGDVWGLPFAIEGIAFFIEAIFVGIYLYGWDRLAPRLHVLCGVPIVVAGVASAWFVVTANAWMNQPAGFDIEHYLATGVVRNVDPWAAMFNPATPPQTTHMVLAAFMVAGFGTAAVYAAGMLRGRRDRYHRLGFGLAFTVAAVITPVQIGVGDWLARFLADNQPLKLAALEGLERTQAGAPLTWGGIYVDGEVRYGITIPRGLSLLAEHDPDAVVAGLDIAPPDERPPVGVVRTAFQMMVGIGIGLLVLAAWFGIAWWRRRSLPRSRWFLRAAVAAGPLAALALEAGWVATEVGRQPWIVYGVMRVDEAVTPAPGIRLGYFALIVVYAVLTVGTIYVLRRVARAGDDGGDDVVPQTGAGQS